VKPAESVVLPRSVGPKRTDGPDSRVPGDWSSRRQEAVFNRLTTSLDMSADEMDKMIGTRTLHEFLQHVSSLSPDEVANLRFTGSRVSKKMYVMLLRSIGT
jgi:hypothetical protein